MCIFSRSIVSVGSTQIFARVTSSGTQFLVYQMDYHSEEPNAIILPVPIEQPAREESLKFINLENYERFFVDLDRGFPFYEPIFVLSSKRVASAIKVVEVGSYIASFLPTMADFSRLDSRFVLPDQVWQKLPQFANYGFAVFQLAEGKRKPHPMAFEFETALETIYFPTVHVHDGEVHEVEDFDHVLYLQHAGFDSRVGHYRNQDVVDTATGMIRSADVAKNFCQLDRSAGIIAGDLLVHRQVVRGRLENQDILIAAAGHPTIPTLNLRPWLRFTPWAIIVAVLVSIPSWFFHRRSQLKEMKRTGEL